MHDDIFARRCETLLLDFLLSPFYLAPLESRKKTAGDKPISHYFHVKNFPAEGKKVCLVIEAVEGLMKITLNR